MDKFITEKKHDIYYYEVDYKRRLLVTSLVNYLEDLATQQSEDVGMGLDYFNDNKLAWVIYKWDISIIRYPVYGETVTVRTWPRSFRKFYAYRQYDILDAGGNVICKADSVWLLIDSEIRRAKRIDDKMYEAFRIDKDNCGKPLITYKMIPPSEIENEEMFNVRYSDIDTNMHVNNVKYIEWAMETVPYEIVRNYTLQNLKVVYEKETNYGEKIKAGTQINKENGKITCIHKIENENGDRLTLLETTWIVCDCDALKGSLTQR